MPIARARIYVTSFVLVQVPVFISAYARIYAGISVRGYVLEFMLAYTGRRHILAFTPA
jgi:hypothetical protein